MKDRELFNTIMQDIWVDLKLEKFDQYYTKDVTGVFGDYEVDASGLKDLVKYMGETFKDVTFELIDIVSNDSRMGVYFTIDCVERDTDQPKRIHVNAMYHLDNGKIAKVISMSDSGITSKFQEKS